MPSPRFKASRILLLVFGEVAGPVRKRQLRPVMNLAASTCKYPRVNFRGVEYAREKEEKASYAHPVKRSKPGETRVIGWSRRRGLVRQNASPIPVPGSPTWPRRTTKREREESGVRRRELGRSPSQFHRAERTGSLLDELVTNEVVESAVVEPLQREKQPRSARRSSVRSPRAHLKQMLLRQVERISDNHALPQRTEHIFPQLVREGSAIGGEG